MTRRTQRTVCAPTNVAIDAVKTFLSLFRTCFARIHLADNSHQSRFDKCVFEPASFFQTLVKLDKKLDITRIIFAARAPSGSRILTHRTRLGSARVHQPYVF